MQCISVYVCVFAHIYSLYLQGNEKDKKASNHTMIAPITVFLIAICREHSSLVKQHYGLWERKTANGQHNYLMMENKNTKNCWEWGET